MVSLPFSFFEKSFSNLEGYVSNLANNNHTSSIPNLSNINYNLEGFNILTDPSNVMYGSTMYNKYIDLSNNLYSYTISKSNEKKYDLIDACGNLLYKKNMNFKETIPPVKDAVLEDSVDVMNYTNNIYIISGITIAVLLIGVIIIKK